MSTAQARVPRHTSTLVAACVAVLVAQIANALPGSLNGLFQKDLHTTGLRADLDHRSIHGPGGRLRADLRRDSATCSAAAAAGRRRGPAGGRPVVSATSPRPSSSSGSAQRSAAWAPAILSPTSLAMVAAVTPTRTAGPGPSPCGPDSSRSAPPSPRCSAGLFVEGGTGGGRTWWWSRAGGRHDRRDPPVGGVRRRRAVSSTSPARSPSRSGLIAVLYALVQGAADGWAPAGHHRRPRCSAWSSWRRSSSSSCAPARRCCTSTSSATAPSPSPAIATVVGMFAFLRPAFSMSIWLGAIQHQSALKIGVLFLFIQAPAFVLVKSSRT